jgi:hypothetical protein
MTNNYKNNEVCMTKYTIYPCTELTWLRLFRRIKKVAKMSKMYIKEINIVPQNVPKEVRVLKNPLKIKATTLKRYTWYSDVPNHITTIILEKEQNEKRQKFLHQKT